MIGPSLEPAIDEPAPLRWRLFFERHPQVALGISYSFYYRDFHIAVGPFVFGIYKGPNDDDVVSVS